VVPLRPTTAAKSVGHRGAAEHTALKWGCDGELSDLDLQRILKRLQAVDPAAEALCDHFAAAAAINVNPPLG